MDEDEVNEYDTDFDEEIGDTKEIEAEKESGNQLDLDCFTNLLGSSNCTVKTYDDNISRKSIDVLIDFPGASIQIVSENDVNVINKDSCDILSDEEDVSKYVIIFVKHSVALYLLAVYDIEINTENIMSEGDIEEEASNIIEGTDHEPSDIS